MLFPKLPEVCLYLIINCLLASHPKHSRIFSTTRFRELVLDYFSEIFTGIRLSNSHINREWIFQQATDLPILTHVAAVTEAKVKKHDPSKGLEKSTYKMANSPLIRSVVPLTAVHTIYHVF